MKFGKSLIQIEADARGAGDTMPYFPYKQMKKLLKKVAQVDHGDAPSGDLAAEAAWQHAFERAIDACHTAFTRAAAQLLSRAGTGGGASSLVSADALRSIGRRLARRGPSPPRAASVAGVPADVLVHARALRAWAFLQAVAVRKCAKKHDKAWARRRAAGGAPPPSSAFDLIGACRTRGRFDFGGSVHFVEVRDPRRCDRVRRSSLEPRRRNRKTVRTATCVA